MTSNQQSATSCQRTKNEMRRIVVIFIMFFILIADSCLPAASSAQTTIRVLLMDNKNLTAPPPRDERLTRLGDAAGDVLLSGIKYSGVIEVWKGDKGLYIINEIPLEEYIKGVVAAEVGSSWDIEALKAQAVVARTFAVYQRYNSPKEVPYNLTSTVLDQAYKGSNVSPNIARAVDETKGEILTYEGTPIVAFYHSTSGGMTEDPGAVFGKELPYLKPVKTSCELSPYYMWEKIIPVAEIEKALDIQGINEINIDSYTVSGRAKEIRITLEKGPYPVLATELRKKLGWDRLPSTLIISISRNNSLMVFEGRGYGHGVGMCQWSALQMAKDGKTYREILSYFYPGTVIQLYEDR